jgi:hypothetical protein
MNGNEFAVNGFGHVADREREMAPLRELPHRLTGFAP